MIELGIVDIREIIRTIKTVHDYDFTNYALTSFKQRLERLMVIYSISNPESLLIKLRDDLSFFDIFLNEIAVPSTEMFRDPSLWRWLREDYFPVALAKIPGKFKIWLPACVSGAELYSLVILLNESGWLANVSITATCFSSKSIETIRQGSYEAKKMEVSEENYKRFNGTRELSAYYKADRGILQRNASLIETVEFKKLNINFDNAPQNNRLILFRNNLIYYNPTHQEKVLRLLHESLSVSGCLVTGIREKITGVNTGRDFEVLNETESVYRKRNPN
jgi:chemotaxis protein methyltransferase CheR